MADGILADPQDAGTGGGGWGAGLGGAPLDPETQRALMMQVGLPAMLAQAGAALMARSQRGLTPAQMAHYGMQLGLAPQAASEAMAAAQQGQQQAIGRKLQMNQMSLQARELESRIRERETNAAQWAVPTGGAPGATGAPHAPGTQGQGGAPRAIPVPPGDLFLPAGQDGAENPYAALAPHLRRQEGGSSAQGAVNPFGFAGRWQFGAPRLAELGVYTPGQSENMQRWNETRLLSDPAKWSGAFHIPGFEHVRTMQDFLADPRAQDHVFNQHMTRIDQTLDRAPGAQNLDRNGLRAAAHLAGENGVVRWLASGGRDNPRDANGASAASYYDRFSRATQGAGGRPNDATPVNAPQAPPAVARLRAMGVPDARIAAIAALPADKRDAAVAELATRAATERNLQVVDGPDGAKYILNADRTLTPLIPGNTPGGVSPDVVSREDALRGQFQALPPVTRFNTSVPLYESVTGALDRVAAGRRTGQDDQIAAYDAVVAYANLLDPTSVVREGEVSNVLRSQGTPSWIISQVERVLGGQPMTPELARQIERSAADRMGSYRRAIDPIATQYRGLATRRGVSPENVVLEIGDPVAARTERRTESHRAGAAALRAAFPDNVTARIAAAIAEGIPEAMVR